MKSAAPAQQIRRVVPLVLVLAATGGITSAARAAGPQRPPSRSYPPLSKNSLHWLNGNNGSGFRVVPADHAAAVPERVAVSSAVRATSMFGVSVRVREVGLKTAIKSPAASRDQSLRTVTSGRPYWIISLLPRTTRMTIRWFFVLIDARSGRVGTFFEDAGVRLPIPTRVAGERPLLSLPNISAKALAISGPYLLDQPGGPARISRARAFQIALKSPLVGHAANS